MCSSTLGSRTGSFPPPAVVSLFSLLGDSVVGFKAFAEVWLVKTVGFLVPLLLLADSVVGFKGLPVICLQ
jgi:hypothetical protein